MRTTRLPITGHPEFKIPSSFHHRAKLLSPLPDYWCAEWQSRSDKTISFMPPALKASDQCYLEDKLIFPSLSLLVLKCLQ